MQVRSVVGSVELVMYLCICFRISLAGSRKCTWGIVLSSRKCIQAHSGVGFVELVLYLCMHMWIRLEEQQV